MTKRKVRMVAAEVRKAIKKEIDLWRDSHQDLAGDVSVEGTHIKVWVGNPTPCTCMIRKSGPKELTNPQKDSIRDFFEKLFLKFAEKLNLRFVARQLRELKTQMVCLFEVRPVLA